MLILDNDNMSLMHFMTTWKQEATAVYTNFRDSLEEHTWQVELVRPQGRIRRVRLRRRATTRCCDD